MNVGKVNMGEELDTQREKGSAGLKIDLSTDRQAICK